MVILPASFACMDNILKRLDCDLAQLLELANGQPSDASSELEEEFLCCCERARHAIKDFTNKGPDATVYAWGPVALDALRDLHWCSGQIFGHKYGSLLRNIQSDVHELGVPGIPISVKQGSSVSPVVSYCLDARNGSGSGSAHLPPGLNLDDFGEIHYLTDLGQGSQGVVYKALWGNIAHLPLGVTEYFSELRSDGVYGAWGQLVAVKEVFSGTRSEGLEALESVARSSESRSDLYSELDVLKTLNHPNIVELKGYTRKVRVEGNYGLVMELMKCSLRDLTESEKQLSDLAKVDTLLQVARGMHFLHMVGIMHRDLKPANVLIKELSYLPSNARCLGYVVAKLADFGLSKQENLAVDAAGWHTFKRGTTFYMAPEVRNFCNDAEGSQYSKSADVFSFGTMCFNLLTGKGIPFVQKDHPLKSEEFYKRIEQEDLDPFVIEYGQSTVALLVRQCWCLDPTKRPTFLQICQILQDEKRQILCNEVGPSEYSDEIKYIHKLGKGGHERKFFPKGVRGNVHMAMWRGVEIVAVKKFFSNGKLGAEYGYLIASNHPNVVHLKGYTRKTCVRAVEPWRRYGLLDFINVVRQYGLLEFLKAYTGRAVGEKYTKSSRSHELQYGVVMELMKCSLQDLIEATPISELMSVDVLLQVARGMEYLHTNGIIHSNLKPTNILIDHPHQSATYVAKITDIWFSESPVYYMELRFPATKFSNVFSFGMTCFYVLTRGQFPCEMNRQLQKCGASWKMRRLVEDCCCRDLNVRPSFVTICTILEEERERILSSQVQQVKIYWRDNGIFHPCLVGSFPPKIKELVRKVSHNIHIALLAICTFKKRVPYFKGNPWPLRVLPCSLNVPLCKYFYPIRCIIQKCLGRACLAGPQHQNPAYNFNSRLQVFHEV